MRPWLGLGMAVSGECSHSCGQQQTHKETGRDKKSRPVYFVQCVAYHATWKPARAPTSPLSKPTPTPADTDDISPTRAEKAAVAAARF